MHSTIEVKYIINTNLSFLKQQPCSDFYLQVKYVNATRLSFLKQLMSFEHNLNLHVSLQDPIAIGIGSLLFSGTRRYRAFFLLSQMCEWLCVCGHGTPCGAFPECTKPELPWELWYSARSSSEALLPGNRCLNDSWHTNYADDGRSQLRSLAQVVTAGSC